MADARYTYTAGIPAARVGSLLERARNASGIAEHDLASMLKVRVRTVRQWERGEFVPTDDQIEAIAATCGVRLIELLPSRTNLSYDSDTGTMRLGDHVLTLPASMRDDDTVLGAFLGLVRRQRGLRPDQDVNVREEDLEALADALDLDDEELEERLVRIVGLSRRRAAIVRAQLMRRRLTAGMVGLVAGLSLIAVNRIFTTATEEVRTVGGGPTTSSNPYVDPTTTTTTTTTTNPTAATGAPKQVPVTAPASTVAVSTTATAVPATLPAVVLAEQFSGPSNTENVRTGPPRTTPTTVVHRIVTPGGGGGTTGTTAAPTPLPTTTQTTKPAPTTTPTTVSTSRPTSPPDPTTAPTTTPTTPPTTGPVVSTVGGGGTTGTTEPPTTTTTTTEPPTTTTTTTTEPPTTTTTEPPTTTTTEAPTTTTTEVAVPAVNNPNILSADS